MGGPPLSRLQRVEDIRTIWRHERYDFSAWLLANSDALADVLGIDLELQHAEQPVGDFAVDLIGRDLTNDTGLMVENQLEATDHSHLGQVLLYAAGTDARTIVWIARRFRAEHRQALSWLNESTGEEFHFFGLEVDVVTIDDSPPAPLLSLAVEPSDWQKRIRARANAARSSGRSQLYLDFWTKFLERTRREHPDWTGRRPGVRGENWLEMPSGIQGTYIAASFARGRRLRHELYIDSGDPERNLEMLRALQGRQAEFEGAYGRPLVFEELPGSRACRIAEYLESADVTEVGRHDEFVAWFLDAGTRLRRALDAVDALPRRPR